MKEVQLDDVTEVVNNELYKVPASNFDSIMFIDGDYTTGLSEEQESEMSRIVSELSDITGYDTSEITSTLAPLYGDTTIHEMVIDENLEYMIISTGDEMEEEDNCLEEIAEVLSKNGVLEYDKEEVELREHKEKVQELQEKLEDKDTEIQELEEKVNEKDEKIEKLEDTVEEFKAEKREELAKEIAEIRDKKGLLNVEREEKVEQLKDKDEQVLEELLEEAKAISEKLSQPSPKVKENSGKQDPVKTEKTMEDYREEMFGYRRDGD